VSHRPKGLSTKAVAASDSSVMSSA
jgi:hypothetical protein